MKSARSKLFCHDIDVVCGLWLSKNVTVKPLMVSSRQLTFLLTSALLTENDVPIFSFLSKLKLGELVDVVSELRSMLTGGQVKNISFRATQERRGKSQLDSRPKLICECQHSAIYLTFDSKVF